MNLYEENKCAVMMERNLKNGKVTDTYLSCYRDKFSATEIQAEAIRRMASQRERGRELEDRQSQVLPVSGNIDDEEGEDWIRRRYVGIGIFSIAFIQFRGQI